MGSGYDTSPQEGWKKSLGELRPQGRTACSLAGAEVSLDCSLSLVSGRGRRLTLLFDLWFWCVLRRLLRRPVRNIAAEPSSKRGFIVGIDLRIVAATRHCDVCEATIDELFSTLFNFDAGCLLDA
jgi:hypothetical protein